MLLTSCDMSYKPCISVPLALAHLSCILFFFVQLWRLPFAQVFFDSDPATSSRAEPQQAEEMSQAMIRCVDMMEGR